MLEFSFYSLSRLAHVFISGGGWIQDVKFVFVQHVYSGIVLQEGHMTSQHVYFERLGVI